MSYLEIWSRPKILKGQLQTDLLVSQSNSFELECSDNGSEAYGFTGRDENLHRKKIKMGIL